ncbi:MAG: hypothetical protein WCF04_11230 [Candidatus Nanopelagicales bacterium]
MIDFDPQRGIDFPVLDGRQSSMATGRAVFAEAARATDPALAARIEATADWRKDYMGPARDLVVSGLQAQDGSVAMSRDGLASMHRMFTFTRDGASGTLAQAFATLTESRFATAEVVGTGRPATQLAIPYHGRDLAGADLRHQLDLWVANGVVEPSFATAVELVAAHPEWLDLTGWSFAVLGAGAQMGPMASLLDSGATVWAVDLPRPELWRRVIADAQGRAGRLRIPVPAGTPDRTSLTGAALAAVAGADLLTHAPEIRTWLRSIRGPFTLGNYVYADGPLHVRASLAIDAISMDLIAAGHEVSLAWLATPTDVFAVPIEAVEESRRRWRSGGGRRLLRAPLRLAGKFQPNYTETVWTKGGIEYGVCDCMVGQQGPNYILAKRLQRWRAMAARADGVRVSLNVAPSTRTSSVVKNRALAAAYAGAGRFGLEIFEPETSNAIMAALLVHDLRNPRSSANPDVPLVHPMQLFVEGACHGGLWRSEYAARSVLGIAAVMGMFERNA